jgi:hypothetical protein
VLKVFRGSKLDLMANGGLEMSLYIYRKWVFDAVLELRTLKLASHRKLQKLAICFNERMV